MADLLRRGVPVGLGTDGCASNNNLDLIQEMDTAAKLQKVHTMDPTVLPAPTALDLATRGGARVLGMEDQVGALGPGLKGDLIVLDLDQPHLTPFYDPYSHLVYAATGADVQTVLVNGRVVVQDRRLLSFDLDETLAGPGNWRWPWGPDRRAKGSFLFSVSAKAPLTLILPLTLQKTENRSNIGGLNCGPPGRRPGR